jgi:Gly-Xaa carboxypeptidase
MEKHSLPIAVEHTAPPNPSSKHSTLRKATLAAALVLGVRTLFSSGLVSALYPPSFTSPSNASMPKCQQVPALFPPQDDKLQQAFEYLSTPEFINASITRLSGAVQIPTQSFDDLGAIGEDKRWEVFGPLHEYFEATFPRIHEKLKVEKVNTHGLLYTWEGSDKGLKPLVLMAHQDVVPVDPDTVDSWTYPPWSGHFDGENIWGRGASDCKNSLVGIMESVEVLLGAGFAPKRTIVMSFGFDEECSGTQGAGHLSKFLHERYGDDGVAAIVDEGMGYTKAFGMGYAVPGVAEKGYTDIEIVVRTPGGHSSVPQDHTSIGILSEVITKIESVRYPTYLAQENPYLGFLQCGAEYAPEFPKKLKKLLKKHHAKSMSEPICPASKRHKDNLALEAAGLGLDVRYLMQTSQAVDLISGGKKTNALPESATAIVNHRINIGDSPKTVYDHISSLVGPIAKAHNLSLHAFDGTKAAYNSISLSSRNTTLQVAPVTPTNVNAVTPWSVLSGTIRALYGEETIVAPALMTGNTDTRYYWDLTRHIFRFGPGYVNEKDWSMGRIHTVDERVSASNHGKVVKWYALWIRNVDAVKFEGEA